MKSIRLAIAVLVALVVGCTGIALAAQSEAEAEDASSAAAELSGAPREAPGPELASKRTATSETFRLPDGALETRTYENPINYRDAEGDWKPIGEGLEELESGGLTNSANRFDLRLPERLGVGPLRISEDGKWVSEKLTHLATEPVQLDANTASYESSTAGVNFDLASLANGVKEAIEIASPDSPSSFTFDLDASDGLQPFQTNTGAIEFRDSGKNVVATLPPPTISDSSGDDPIASPVSYELQEGGQGGSWTLTVRVDQEWLSDPERIWPATIDPTLTLESPALDCTYGNLPGSEGWRECGSSGAQSLFASYGQQEKQVVRSMLRFSGLEVIPTNASITNATVKLVSPVAAENTAAVQLRRATKSWQSTLNWLHYAFDGHKNTNLWTTPGGDYTTEGAEVLTSQRGSGAGAWEFSSPELTKLVTSWVKGSASNQGFILKNANESSKSYVRFNSSAVADTHVRPSMSVVYYPKSPSTSTVTSPTAGYVTSKELKLQAGWSVQGTTGVTFQYWVPHAGHSHNYEPGMLEWKNIPSNLIRTQSGNEVVWPMAVQGNQSVPVFFDAGDSYPRLQKQGGKLYVRAIFEGSAGAAGYSEPVSATVERGIGGPRDATTGIGPGNLDLLTGNYSITRTDVSIPGFSSSLEFARTLNSRAGTSVNEAGGAHRTSPLGAGWNSTVPVEAAGSEWQKLTNIEWTGPEAEEVEEEVTGLHGYATLTDVEGNEFSFEHLGATYVSPGEVTGYILSRIDENHFALTDPAGDTTTFEKKTTNEYFPVSISQSNGNQGLVIYEIFESRPRLHMMIAPSGSGPNCLSETALTTLGCRSLVFNYQPATNWGAPSNYGQRLAGITYYGPANVSSIGSWEVAKYNYDSQGRLMQEWDPRVSPALKESYAYKAGGELATLTQPGQEPWTFDYYEGYNGEEILGRLKDVKRASLLSEPSVAQSTVVYGVPLEGSGAPYDMKGSTVALWGQQEIPVDATAIFPPDQIPGSPPSSYSRATVYYMDFEGQLVNTATPSGAGTSAPSITTSESDEHGNVLRELSAQNRLRALAAGSEAEKVAKSHELETKRKFNAGGTEMLEEWGPMHQTRLESGEVVQARLHKTIEYDVGEPVPPAGMPYAHLPTRETTGASIPGRGTDADQRETETKYDWTLRKPTEVIVDPLGMKLRTVMSYDGENGLLIEKRSPAGPSGGDAHSTKFYYYSSQKHFGDPAACRSNPAWANLPCEEKPAAQPGTPGQPELLVTKYLAYSPTGQPTEVSESPGGGATNVRKTSMSYDAAGRLLTKSRTGGGESLPGSEITYNTTSGMPEAERFTCTSCDIQEVKTTYDALGRVTKYQDADGNTATTAYDLLGRVSTTNDGKGTQTRTYDPTSGLLTKLEDSGAGTFTASYDADGNLTEEGLPDGLLAKSIYNEVDEPVHLSYEKKTFCSISCTWLDFSAERSIYGQVLSQSSLSSAQQYSYDKAGRLSIVRDTPQGGGCTTRSYSYDADSNRTALVTRAPGIGGACDLVSEGTPQTYKYDAADRLLENGIQYDSFGRITSLPAVYAGGGTMTTTYYSNDLIKSQSQGGITNTYELDGAMRQRSRVEAGGPEPGTEVYHYEDGSDSPAWIDRGSSWSRNVVGIAGNLAAIQDSIKGTTLQLTDLHGDVRATASISPEATKLLATFEFNEFGSPEQGSAGKYGWLGGRGRASEFPSGIVQMGARSYVPEIGRFISADPVQGGSANAYDYANADPVNGLDLAGTSPYNSACLSGFAGCKCVLWAKFTGNTRGRITLTTVRKCNVAGGITLGGLASEWGEGNGSGFHSIPPPRPVYAVAEPLCRATDPCQNYQKHVRTFYCDPGMEYEFSLTWEFQINLEGLPAHTLDIKIEQFCPR